MKARLSADAIVAILQGPFGQKVVSSGAATIAANTSATSHDGPVKITVHKPHAGVYSAVAAVTLDHPGGYAIEAKHAPLTRAAAAAGYRVKGGAS